MSVRNFNNLTTIGTLVAPIAASVTTISVQSFSQSPPVPYTVTLDRNLATEEICLVTAQAGSSLTVIRGFDGTAAQSHTAGATIEHTAGAIEYAEANAHVNATVGVHGTTGNLVGSEGAQSIFDKTLVAPLLMADVADGDAVVAYDPTGTRNLFRGMNQSGTDVITVDNTGKVNATGLAVSGASTTTGLLTANGGVTVPAGKAVTASGGVSTTTVTASGAVSGASVTASGAISGTTITGTAITGTGLVKGAGVESTAGLTLAQIAAPAGVASKGQVWSQSDGGLYTRAGTNAVGRVPVHWGSGTTPPATGVLTGDRYYHTQYGPMNYNGTAWLPVGSLHGFLVHANSSQNVAGGGSFTFTFAALPASVVAGMRVRGTVTVGYWNNNASNAQLGATTVAATNATVSGTDAAALIAPAAEAQEYQRPFYLDVTATSPVVGVTVAVTGGSPTVTFGPVRLDFSTGFAA